MGIPESQIKRVFDPFYTTKMGRGGTGLGRSMVHSIVTGPLGGTVELASTVGSGTVLALVLPLLAPSPIASLEPEQTPNSSA
jgi:signal transduction histidine kinase